MVSKVRERTYVESAARFLDVEWNIFDIPEPPDFEVRTISETFGLEVRQVFFDQEKRFGSPSKRAEAENQRVVSELANRYYKLGGQPVAAKFLGPIDQAAYGEIVDKMLRYQPKYPNGRSDFVVQNVQVYLSAAHPSFQHRAWSMIGDHAGWVREATSDELQQAVDRKSGNLRLYLDKYPTVDLLLVADRTSNSGRIDASDELRVRNPGFRAIYFLSHPISVSRIG